MIDFNMIYFLCMIKQKTFIASFVVLVAVAFFNNLGTNLNLYWIYRWYDIPMHMLGGLWVALFSLSLYPLINELLLEKGYKISAFYLSILALLFMTISWELFELLGQITTMIDIGYWSDTLSDILNGYIGGMFGYLFYLKHGNLDLVLSNKIIK